MLFYSLLKSPLGYLGLVASGQGLRELRIKVESDAAFRRYLEPRYPVMPRRNPNKMALARQQLTKYFAGGLQRFDLPLDVAGGTEFQRRVWQTLSTIPFGQTRHYCWLAAAVDRPQAVRAVGNANGKNPLPIILPCHRVILKSGGLGGFTGGLDLKRFLLHLEGA
ncbi:MAG: methylated-DNA--[protein]-cysteine S-methyltransferase [Nitrospinaceae bacterium]